jgi:hypothetical protein
MGSFSQLSSFGWRGFYNLSQHVRLSLTGRTDFDLFSIESYAFKATVTNLAYSFLYSCKSHYLVFEGHGSSVNSVNIGSH